MKIRSLALASALLLASPLAAFADGPHAINYNWHDPVDLKATTPPGPKPGVDGVGTYLVIPGGPAVDDDPTAARWPTVDRSEWVQYKGQYIIQPK